MFDPKSEDFKNQLQKYVTHQRISLSDKIGDGDASWQQNAVDLFEAMGTREYSSVSEFEKDVEKMRTIFENEGLPFQKTVFMHQIRLILGPSAEHVKNTFYFNSLTKKFSKPKYSDRIERIKTEVNSSSLSECQEAIARGREELLKIRAEIYSLDATVQTGKVDPKG